MAKAIVSGIAADDKTSCTSFNTQADPQPPSKPASASTPPPASTLWAGLVSLLPEQSRLALGAFVTALISPPALPGTAPALPEASQQSIGNEVVESDRGHISTAIATILAAEAGNGSMPSAVNCGPPSRLTVIPSHSKALEPFIFVAERADRSSLGTEPLLQRPGIYLGLWANRAYVGMGERVGARASSNDRLGGLDPADRIICIVDQHGRMSKPHALVAERLMAQTVHRNGERRLVHSMPVGAPVDPDSYNADRLFVARACLALREAGLLFTRLPAAALLLPPTQAPAHMPLLDDTPIYAIAAMGLRAHLAECAGEWRLLRGSEIRANVRTTAYGPAQMGRSELLHTGGLLRTGPVLILTQDLVFSSGWAAAHFVLGERPRSDAWKPLSSPIGTDQPHP